MSSNSQLTIGVSAIDNAKQVLQGVDQKVTETANNVDAQSGRMVTRTSMMAQKFRENYGQIAVAGATLAAGIVSFATSFSTLEKAQNTANAAQITYEKSLQRLEKLRASGTASAEKLATAELEVATNLDKLKTAQGNVNDVYANFLAQVPLQFMSFATGASSIMKALGVDLGRNTAAATANATAMRGQAMATGQATAATHGFRAASVMAFISNPVGIAIIAVTSLIVALAFNVGGLRDRVFELGNAIMAFLDLHFRPLADAIRWFIENVAKPLGAFFGNALPSDVGESQNALLAFENTTVQTGKGITAYKDMLGELAEQYAVDIPTSAAMSVEAFASVETAAVSSAQAIQTSADQARTALEALAAAQNRSVVTLGGVQTGLSGTVSVASVIAAGFGGNNSIMQSAQAGRLGGVFTGAGRILDSGGTLYENVLGFGTETGTPHLLHKGEDVVPRGKGSNGPTIIQLVTPDKRVFAEWLINDITRLYDKKTTAHMRITHEGIYGVG